MFMLGSGRFPPDEREVGVLVNKPFYLFFINLTPFLFWRTFSNRSLQFTVGVSLLWRKVSNRTTSVRVPGVLQVGGAGRRTPGLTEPRETGPVRPPFTVGFVPDKGRW